MGNDRIVLRDSGGPRVGLRCNAENPKAFEVCALGFRVQDLADGMMLSPEAPDMLSPRHYAEDQILHFLALNSTLNPKP